MSVVILRGDAAHLPLPDESVDLICTSPPYFGQRSYTDGGEVYYGQIGAETTPREYVAALLNCTREWMRVLKPTGSLFVNLGDKYSTYTGANWGNGRSLNGYRGVEKVPHGGPVNAPAVYGVPYKSLMGLPWRYVLGCIGTGSALDSTEVVKLLLRDVALGVISLAMAEQIVDELAVTPATGLGLVLRAEIIWSKPNGMPESVSDRVRRSHEQVFHLVKQSRGYFAGVDEIREPHTMQPQRRPNGRSEDLTPRQGQPRQAWSTAARDEAGVDGHPLGKLPSSVWQIASQPLKVPADLGADHYAAYPSALPRRIILGWSPSGICTECGEGRRPIVARSASGGERIDSGDGGRGVRGLPGYVDIKRSSWREGVSRDVTGYACACTPYTDYPERRGKDFHATTDRARQGMNDGNGGERYRRYVEELANPREPVREYDFDSWAPPPTRAAVVLDPFGGTGTTALVADMLGRTGITVDRSADYCRIAQWRTSDPAERARALGVAKPPPVMDGQASLFDGLEAS